MLHYFRGEAIPMRCLAAAMLFLGLFATRLFAQGGNASVSGFVQDPSKAYLPGVSVLAINMDTNQQFEGKTNKDGSYSLPSLPVGPYRIQLEKAGFRYEGTLRQKAWFKGAFHDFRMFGCLAGER